MLRDNGVIGDVVQILRPDNFYADAHQKIFQAIAVTPITLSEVLWAEIMWDASKATFSASVVITIGIAMGDFNRWGALLALPICFAGAVLFAAALAGAGAAKSGGEVVAMARRG